MDGEQTEGLDIRYDDGVLRITLDRPAALNAMTAAMSDRIAAELEGAAARDDVRVVLLAGAGGAFSSGADLSGADAHENFDVTSLDRANRIIRAIVGLDKPVRGRGRRRRGRCRLLGGPGLRPGRRVRSRRRSCWPSPGSG